MGAAAIHCLVARDLPSGEVERGYVESFKEGSREEEPTWELRYPSSEEAVAVRHQELQRQLSRRHQHESGTAPEQIDPGPDPVLGKLLQGVDQNWASSFLRVLAYDVKHWMVNWASMIIVDKHSEILR